MGGHDVLLCASRAFVVVMDAPIGALDALRPSTFRLQPARSVASWLGSPMTTRLLPMPSNSRHDGCQRCLAQRLLSWNADLVHRACGPHAQHLVDGILVDDQATYIGDLYIMWHGFATCCARAR